MNKFFLTLLITFSLYKGAYGMQESTQCSKPSVTLNGTYEHYKGMRYKVLMVIFNSEGDELEEWVVYQGLYEDPKLGKNPIFGRSLTKFMETIEINGTIEPRFKLLSDS